MNSTPQGSRLHIAIFGRRNSGKSSLINSLTNQDIALVSDIPGTTTDPVYKAMEILPLGPVTLIDTAGIDDEGELGGMRVKKTLAVLEKTDLALIVVDAKQGLTSYEAKISKLCEERSISVLFVFSKEDLIVHEQKAIFSNNFKQQFSYPYIWVSNITKSGINALKEKLNEVKPTEWLPPTIIGDLLEKNDLAILVVPIDSAAPKGRLILPQVQTIRDILDHQCLTLVCQEHELNIALQALNKPPKLVVTDSQAFKEVASKTPQEVGLTSFSILMARYKGDLLTLAKGAKSVDSLNPGDKVLIAEACTHHQQPDDIGTVKIPKWLEKTVGGKLQIDFCNGTKFPDNLQHYKLVVHCGSCMLNRKEMLHRINQVKGKGVPIVNYGVLIAHIHGILPRALAPFSIDFAKL